MRVSELIAMIEAIKEAAIDYPLGKDQTVLLDVSKDSFTFVCNEVLHWLYKIKETV